MLAGCLVGNELGEQKSAERSTYYYYAYLCCGQQSASNLGEFVHQAGAYEGTKKALMKHC